MQNPLFKLTALASVIGAGMTVVYEAQQHLGGAGSLEQFAPLAALSPVTPTADEAPTAEKSDAPDAAPLAGRTTQVEPTAFASGISVSGPTPSTSLASASPTSAPNALSFLYDGNAGRGSDTGFPAQPEPLVTAELTGHSEPTSGLAAEPTGIQLVSGEQVAPESKGLSPFPVAGGTPTLLTPPDNPPMPPRQNDELPSAQVAATELVQAGFDTAKEEVTELAEQVGGVELAAATSDLLTQADPFPATAERTREPAPNPALLNQAEPPDLFGPLPTSESPTPSADLLPPPAAGAETLVLPPSAPVGSSPAPTAIADDPFPAAIPGTEPTADFLPQDNPVPAPRERLPAETNTPPAPTPALFPEVTAGPTTTAPSPSAEPIESLFLPDEPRAVIPPTAAAPAGTDAMLLPPAPIANDDPFAATPVTTAAPTPTPNPPAGNLTATAPAAPPPNRTRTQPTPPPTMTQSNPVPTPALAPTGESPFFATEPAPAGLPRRTAEPTPVTDPFPASRSPAPSSIPSNDSPLIFPDSTGNRPPLRSEPATRIPSFPNDNELNAPAPAFNPSRTSIPTNSAPVPDFNSLTFPDRTAPQPMNIAPTRSSIPDFNTTTTPNRSTVDPFPRPSDLAGTGTFDSTAPAGMQPELQIEKEAPPKAMLNQPLIYGIRVRNVGRSAAHQVIVEDGIPRGSRLEGTNPEAELDPVDKHLIWRFGTLAPGEEQIIKVKIVPTEPGEIGSVATVRFVGRIAAKTIITAPRVQLEMSGPVETAVGDVPVYRLRVTNVGDGDATNVAIKSALPQVFQHPSGGELEYTVGDLPAGQHRELELALSAVKPGQASQTFIALVDDKEQDRDVADVVVLASRLSIERTGPEKRFVNRPAKYTTQVTNQSSETLRNVTVAETLPAGVELAAVPQHGRYDPSRRTVTWVIPQLGPQETQQIESSLVTADQGNYATTVQVWDAAGNKAEATSQLQVAGFSSLKVDVAQTTHGGGEVAVGDQVALRMTVANRGSAPATDVVTEFDIPAELEFVAAKPEQYELVDRKVRFQAIPQLDINGQQVIDIVCVARQPGRPQIAASIWSKEQSPIRQAEAVVVFREDQ